MAKDFENEFYDELESKVAEKKIEQKPLEVMPMEEKIQVLSELPLEEIKQAISTMSLEEKRSILIGCIAALESNVIRDPRTIESLKKELASVEKQLMKQEQKEEIMEKAVETGEVTVAEEAEDQLEQEEKEQEEEEKEEKEEQLEEQKTEQEIPLNEEELKQQYYDAMVALHEKRVQTIRKQLMTQPTTLVSEEADYKLELELEAKMYEARDAYMKLGKGDPFSETRTDMIRIEKEEREPIERELRNAAKRFKENEKKLKELDEEEQEINKMIEKENASDSTKKSGSKRLEEIAEERAKIEKDNAYLKSRLDGTMKMRHERAIERAGLEYKHVQTLTEEDRRNYAYQKSKVDTMNRNFDAATKQHYDNINDRIEQREQRIKDINKELESIPNTDFERRLVLLNALDKETHMLDADQEAKKDLDQGIVQDQVEMERAAQDKTEIEKQRKKEFKQSTEKVREVVEAQKQQIGEAVVEQPNLIDEQEQDRDTTMKAAAVAVAYDNPKPGPDTLLEDAGQFAVAKCVIEGLEEQVRDPNKLEDAKAIVAHDEQLRQANAELERVQKDIEKNIQG